MQYVCSAHGGRIRFRPYVRSLAGEACLAPTIAPGAHYFQLQTSNLSEARPITYLGTAAPPTSRPHCPFRGGVSNATDGTKQKNDPATTPHNSKKNGTAHKGGKYRYEVLSTK